MAFVGCKLTGRLGNNCFQIMTCIAHALKHGADYKIPAFTKSKYTKNCPFDQFPKLTAEDEARIEYEHYQDGWTFEELPYRPNMRLGGWFQNLNYFDAYKKEIIEVFNLPKEKIDAVAVHVRMGDYKRYPTKHPILPIIYYIKAIDFAKYANPSTKFHVFSDDQEAREMIRDADKYIINGDPMEDWVRMAQYKFFIIANSTYSYTAAYLSGSDHVIAPHEDRWYGINNKHIYTGDLIPKTWIKI